MSITQKINARLALTNAVAEAVLVAKKAGLSEDAIAEILESLKAVVEEGDD